MASSQAIQRLRSRRAWSMAPAMGTVQGSSTLGSVFTPGTGQGLFVAERFTLTQC